jgi:hypothetical protein
LELLIVVLLEMSASALPVPDIHRNNQGRLRSTCYLYCCASVMMYGLYHLAGGAVAPEVLMTVIWAAEVLAYSLLRRKVRAGSMEGSRLQRKARATTSLR